MEERAAIPTSPVDRGMIAIGKTDAPMDPLYYLPLGTALTFNLTSPASMLVVDFGNGSPLAAGNVQVNGGGFSDSTVRLLGAGTTFTLSDTQLAPVSGGALSFTNLGTLNLWHSTVYSSGSLDTLQNLILSSGTTFIWC